MRARMPAAFLTLALALAGCGAEPGPSTPPEDGTGSASADDAGSPEPSASLDLDGSEWCPDGEDPGGATWDYGANPKGYIDEPVAWVRENAVGLDPGFEVAMREEVGGLEDLVTATRDDGAIVLHVTFSQGKNGRWMPASAGICPSAGLTDFLG